jgi:hypothetical protein
VGSTTVALAARWQRWQRRGRALAKAWRRRRERCGIGGDSVSTPAASSLAAAAAAWGQRGVGGGGTINNQLKASAATASETAMMTAITTMIKTKATAVAAAAWRQRGGGRGGSGGRGGGRGDSAAAEVAAWQQRGSSGQRNGSIGSALAAVAAPRQSVGDSVAAVAGALRQWRRRRQHSGGVSLASAWRRRWRHYQQSTKSVGGNGVRTGNDDSDNDDNKNEGGGGGQWTLHSRQRSTHDRGNEANQEGATPPATPFYYWTYTCTIGRTSCSSDYLPLIQEIVDTEGGSDCEMPSQALHLGCCKNYGRKIYTTLTPLAE